LVSRLLHNRPVAYGLQFFRNYLSFFDGNFLFVIGDRVERSNSPNMGELYFFDLLFLLLGVYFFLSKKPQNWQIPFLWLLISPLAGALTFQVPSALRTHNMIFPLIIISAYGFWNVLLYLKNGKKLIAKALYSYTPKLLYPYTPIFLIALFIIWNISYFLHQYFVHYPKTYPAAWEYGFKELVDYIAPIKDNYSKIYITEKYDQPYILFLFYLKYPPQNFQQEAVLTPRDKFGFSTVRNFANFHFENIKWEEVSKQKNVLICGTEEEIPRGEKITKIINFPNNKPAFICVEIK
jgi:hypothetical protein